MPKWVLICANCKTEFQHSQISDVGMARLLLPSKPNFEPNGNVCVCPSCGKSAIYKRTDLLFRI
jgi:DNA-directed RNA polymerase subunit RPC12/RpoP